MSADAIRPERLVQAATTAPGRTRARLAALLTAAGRADLAARIPSPDSRARQAAPNTCEAT